MGMRMGMGRMGGVDEVRVKSGSDLDCIFLDQEFGIGDHGHRSFVLRIPRTED